MLVRGGPNGDKAVASICQDLPLACCFLQETYDNRARAATGVVSLPPTNNLLKQAVRRSSRLFWELHHACGRQEF